MNVYVAAIVEGQTEQSCVERLLHRLWAEMLHQPERLQVLEPFRGHRDALVHPNGLVLTESVQKAFLKLQAKTRKDPEARQKQTRRYEKTADAAVFVRGMSLEQCRANSPSFDKLCRELALRWQPPEITPATATETDPGQAIPPSE